MCVSSKASRNISFATRLKLVVQLVILFVIIAPARNKNYPATARVGFKISEKVNVTTQKLYSKIEARVSCF